MERVLELKLFVRAAHATARVATASVVDADDEPVDTTLPLEQEEHVWVTSQGNFKFKLEDQPPQLQVIYLLLKVRKHLYYADTRIYFISIFFIESAASIIIIS